MHSFSEEAWSVSQSRVVKEMLVVEFGLGFGLEPFLGFLLDVVLIDAFASRFARNSFCTYSWSVAM